ncbi:glycine zipper 2TM domain-containing protein [Sphingopyxis sp. LARHCG72]
MRNLTKGLMGAFAAASVALTAPAYAGIAAPAKADGFHQLDQSSGFHKKRKDRRYYARDQRVNSNTRIWRGDDGRYRCKKDNGTTGLLIGGAVGGLAGHEIAGGGDKLLGTVLGAAGGALLGREIDRDKYRCR